MQKINFYRNRVAINVLAKDIANAREIFDAAEGHAVIGVLSAQFSPRWMRGSRKLNVGWRKYRPFQ